MKRVVLLIVAALLLHAVPAFAQTSWTLTFTASPDHNVTAQGVALVASYELVVTPQGGQAQPALGLSKPTPSTQNQIALNVTPYINSLAPGQYTAIVRAVGPGGVGASPVSPSFTLVVPAPGAPGVPGLTKSGS